MIVKDMLEDMRKNPKMCNIERHMMQALRNGAILAEKHAHNFKDFEALIIDSTRQFQVLRDAVNDDDDKLYHINIEPDLFIAFKENLPKEYAALERLFVTATN